jgi:hypothetical protein
MTAQEFRQRFADELAQRIEAAYVGTGFRVWRGRGEPELEDATPLVALAKWETGVVPLSLWETACLLRLPYWFVIGFQCEWMGAQLNDQEIAPDLRPFVEFGRWVAQRVAMHLGFTELR